MCQLLDMFDPFDESAPNPYEAMSVDEIIAVALRRLDAVTLTPEQASEILEFHLMRMEGFIDDGTLEPDEFVSDETFAYAEIAGGEEPRSFGEVYRKYHVSSKGQPLMGGVRETGLASDLEGGIWSEISLWKLTSDYRRRRDEGQL